VTLPDPSLTRRLIGPVSGKVVLVDAMACLLEGDV
jgi:hypothetical protein